MDKRQYGPIAQLVEPPAHNRKVPGSIPGGPTINMPNIFLNVLSTFHQAGGLVNRGCLPSQKQQHVSEAYSIAGTKKCIHPDAFFF